DPLRQRVLVQGGKAYGALGLLSDTWALTLDSPAHWDPIATTGVQVTRYGGGGIVDVVNDRFVIRPGNFLPYPPPAGQRWSYALPLSPGGEWSVLTAADPYQGVGDYVLAYDTRRQRMVSSGGAIAQALDFSGASGWSRLWPTDPVRAPQAITGNVLVAD